MSYGAQTLEKNHFLVPQNRTKKRVMQNRQADPVRKRSRVMLLLMAAMLAVATLAPVAVLAG